MGKIQTPEELLLAEEPEVALYSIDIALRCKLWDTPTTEEKRAVINELLANEHFIDMWHKLGKTDKDLEAYLND